MYPCRILKDPCNYSYRILQNPRISKDPCTCILVGSSRILATILTASCTIPGSSRILAHVSLQDPQGSLQLFLQDPAEFQDLLGSLYMFAYRILQNPRILEGPCDYLLGSYRNLESLENIFEDCGKLPHRWFLPFLNTFWYTDHSLPITVVKGELYPKNDLFLNES